MQTTPSRNGASKVEIHSKVYMGISRIKKIPHHFHLYKFLLEKLTMKVS